MQEPPHDTLEFIALAGLAVAASFVWGGLTVAFLHFAFGYY